MLESCTLCMTSSADERVAGLTLIELSDSIYYERECYSNRESLYQTRHNSVDEVSPSFIRSRVLFAFQNLKNFQVESDQKTRHRHWTLSRSCTIQDTVTSVAILLLLCLPNILL